MARAELSSAEKGFSIGRRAPEGRGVVGMGGTCAPGGFLQSLRAGTGGAVERWSGRSGACASLLPRAAAPCFCRSQARVRAHPAYPTDPRSRRVSFEVRLASATTTKSKSLKVFIDHLPGLASFPLPSRKERAVAQLGRALRSGRRGRGFESRQPDHAFHLGKPRKSGVLRPNPSSVWFGEKVDSPTPDATQNFPTGGLVSSGGKFLSLRHKKRGAPTHLFHAQDSIY